MGTVLFLILFIFSALGLLLLLSSLFYLFTYYILILIPEFDLFL